MTFGLFDSLGTINDFLTWQHRFAGVEGFLHDLEGYVLMQLAAKGGGVGAIVEIGSFMGRSTAFLAAGSKMAGRERVVAVDHFRGSIEHQAGGTFANATLIQHGTTFHRFQQNLQRLGLDDHVITIQNSSANAAKTWQGPVRLLFIDGDHAYESCRQDFEAWAPFLVPHGLVCFHDVTNYEGVARFYQELLAGRRGYQEVAGVVSMKIVEKVA
jgi:predicted O-methyltransferase YrrM